MALTLICGSTLGRRRFDAYCNPKSSKGERKTIERHETLTRQKRLGNYQSSTLYHFSPTNSLSQTETATR